MSETTNEIRETVNAVLDYVDYCCQRLEISEEEQKKFFDFVGKDILIPTLKNTIMDALKTARYGTKPTRAGFGTGNESWQRPLKTGKKFELDFELDNLYFSTFDEAYQILSKLKEFANEYGQVTVGHLYELLGESSPYTMEYYGWDMFDLEHAKIFHKGTNIHKLELPKPVRLEYGPEKTDS